MFSLKKPEVTGTYRVPYPTQPLFSTQISVRIHTKLRNISEYQCDKETFLKDAPCSVCEVPFGFSHNITPERVTFKMRTCLCCNTERVQHARHVTCFTYSVFTHTFPTPETTQKHAPCSKYMNFDLCWDESCSSKTWTHSTTGPCLEIRT